MNSKRLIYVAGAILLVSALLVGTAALADTEAAYYWSSPTSSYVAQFDNTGNGYGTRAYTSGANVISQYGSAYGSGSTGFRGYAHLGSGWGVYGRSGATGIGVYGEASSTSSGYGGYFQGYYGVRGFSTNGLGYGGWFSNYSTNGIGVRGYADGSNGIGVSGYGTNYGVYGESPYRGGYFYGYGSGAEGMRGYSTGSGGDGVNGYATASYGYGVDSYASGYGGIGIRATAGGENAYGAYFGSSNYRGAYVDANDTVEWWDLYVNNFANIAGTVFGPKAGSLGFLARNDGAEALKPGDLVAFRGMDAQALGIGAVTVAKAGATPGVIVGVVEGAYALQDVASGPAAVEALPEAALNIPARDGVVQSAPVPDGEAPALDIAAHQERGTQLDAPAAMPNGNMAPREADGLYFAGGDAAPGGYLQVSFQGFVKVNVTATRPIKVGDWIVVAPDGTISGVPARSYSDALNRGYTVVGRAMEPLASGSGQLQVQVNLR